jgi:hypothetical protein
MANASYLGRGAPDDGAELVPSFRAGCGGFTGAEELQRSEKSDIVIGSADDAPGAVFGFARLRVSEELRALQELTLTLTHVQKPADGTAALGNASVDDVHETMFSSCLPPVATTAIEMQYPALFLFVRGR